MHHLNSGHPDFKMSSTASLQKGMYEFQLWSSLLEAEYLETIQTHLRYVVSLKRLNHNENVCVLINTSILKMKKDHKY